MAAFGPLVGRPSKLTITDPEGNVVIKQGEIITSGVIETARSIGRLDDLMLSEAMCDDTEIEAIPKYIEIGEENPSGVHPESR